MSSDVVDNAVTHAFQGLGHEWALLTAGDKKKFNTMTISWGALGFIWERPIVTVMVRPVRYTYGFIEKFNEFTVSFYTRQYRKSLAILGSKSGRDVDKVALAGLTPTFIDGIPTFKESYLTVVARKLCRMQLKPTDFVNQNLDGEFYPEKDYHTVYQAEIIKVVKER
ncbi:flavin reductase [Telmatospirillum sp.]|uniref:flavin reductase n=1 Tax=Telmatospirillum sp. TaxID=2079197 RepID=UPI00284977DA|nr:flavin reductase [Telmatospirillum sp.]MDR3435122.1 flavin reductase [Telmatospirillum sp.]